MPEIKHTPGPWIIKDKTYHELITNPGIDTADHKRTIVLVGCGSGDLSGIIGANEEEQQANAKLICAAPEMAEMLRELRNAIRYGEKVPQAAMDARITGILTKAGY